MKLDETLIEVWRQALVENAKAVKVGKESYPVRQTPKRGLRQVDSTSGSISGISSISSSFVRTT
jgi:hypothetical protein